MEEELDQDVHREVQLLLGQGHEGQDERVLLLDLVEYDVPAPGLPELVVDDCARYGRKEEHVEKDEHDVEYVVGLIVLDSQDLEIGVEVPG